MSHEQFVVITDHEDEKIGHIPLVAEHMGEEKLTVIDPVPAVVSGGGLSYTMGDKNMECVYEGMPLDRVAAVWDRRPTAASREVLKGVNPDFYSYSWSAVRQQARQLYTCFPDALWVSDRYAVEKAEHKLFQLVEASRLGFAVPRTLLTSDAEAAQHFVAQQKATIIKGLSVEGPTIGDTLLLFFSTRVTPESSVDYSNLNLAPAIFQQAIDADYDIRITVVGDKIFPASVKADVEKDLTIGVRDWRIGNNAGSLLIEPCDIPPDIEEKCFSLVRKLGLKFGAIDMIRDKQGAYWFIEINPNGQWGFVELETQQPIGRAMAQLLLSGAERTG